MDYSPWSEGKFEGKLKGAKSPKLKRPCLPNKIWCTCTPYGPLKGQLMQTCNCFCICKEPNYKTNAKPNTKNHLSFCN